MKSMHIPRDRSYLVTDKMNDTKMLSRAAIMFRSIVNDPRVCTVFRLGSKTFEAFGPMIDKPSALNFVGGVFNVCKSLIDHYEIYANDYLAESTEWVVAYGADFAPLILHALQGCAYTVMHVGDRSARIKIVDLGDGCKVAWCTWERSAMRLGSIYFHVYNREMTSRKVKAVLWDMYKDTSLTMRRIPQRGEDGMIVEFEPDTLFTPCASERATVYSTYLKRCLDAGVARSVMFYGPPGTGKSTLACTIVNTLKLRSFRIRIGDLENIDNKTLFCAIDTFMPDAVILDDFDRSEHQDDLLEVLEYFRQRVSLVIATVNNRSLIDEAILRPGRFDEMISVQELDEGVIKNVLGDDNVDVFDQVKSWPIAFVHEFVKRRKFLTKDEALESVTELQKRVDRLKKYDDDDSELLSNYIDKRAIAKRLGIVDVVPTNSRRH